MNLLSDRVDQATGEEHMDERMSPIIVDDHKMEETPVAEVSTTEGHYGVEAMLDSGAGASVCSPNDFPTVAIDTKSEVTKVYRCADGRELRAYGYKWVKACWQDPADLADPIHRAR
eukprot:3431572-Amphidinium_carterae.1